MSALAADPIETAIRGATVRAIRKRAAVQLGKAVEGTLPAGDQFPGVMIRSRQAATAAALAVGLEAIAADIEAEASQ
jgi:hypothetical protein